MKRTRCLLSALLIVALAIFVSGCATRQNAKSDSGYSGFLENYPAFKEGVDGVDKRYLKKGVDFGKYDKVMMDEVVFFFKNDAEYKGIKPSEIQELGEQFHKTFVEVLGARFTSEPGPDVIRLRLAVTDLEPSNPVTGAATTVVPVGLAVSLVKKGVTGSYTGIGSASMEAEFLDSQTNEPVAVAIDKAPGGKFDVGKLSPAKAAFEFWAKRLRAFMDESK